MPGPPKNPHLAKLRSVALAYPETTEEFPWGDRVVKVKGKVFIFMGSGDTDDGVGLSVKLPQSGTAALALPFCAPTGYGLGKSGWVSVRFAKGEKPPMPLLLEWLE